MSKEIKLTYHGLVISKKNSRVNGRDPRTGRSFSVMNPRAKANQNDMIRQFQGQLGINDFNEPVVHTACDIQIDITEPDWHRRDLDNQATSILDALVAARVLVDDGIKHMRRLSVGMVGVNKNDPRAEIRITILDEEEAK